MAFLWRTLGVAAAIMAGFFAYIIVAAFVGVAIHKLSGIALDDLRPWVLHGVGLLLLSAFIAWNWDE